MKRLLLKLAAIACFFLPFGIAKAQSPFTDEQKKLIEQIKKKMDETELGLIAESDVTFGEAKSILENVSAEDLEIEKLFMKGSSPKAEKKAVNVKRNRIEAAKLYEKGYNMIFEACESRLKQIKFPDNTKQAKSKEISSLANETMTGAVTKGDDYKYLKDKDLETLRYDDLKSRIEGVNKLFIEGINSEFDAWKLYFSQFAAEPEPTEAKPADSTATVATETPTETPKTEVTSTEVTPIQSTENSDKISNGTVTTLPNQQSSTSESVKSETVSNNIISEKAKDETTASQTTEAKPSSTTTTTTSKSKTTSKAGAKGAKSAKVETVSTETTTTVTETASASTSDANTVATPKTSKKSSKKNNGGSSELLESSSNSKGTVYMVQLLAIQRGKLSSSARKQLYSGDKKIYEDYENELYKYRVGEFTSEDEAIKFKQEYGKGCFVLKLIDGIRQMDYINK